MNTERSQIIKQSNELDEIVGILMEDLKRVIAVSDQKMKELRESPGSVFLSEQETWFRLSNRIVLTTIESICFKLKQIALLACQLWNRPLKPREQQILEEKRADGKSCFIPTASNVKFAFKFYAYAFECDYSLDCSGNEWTVFLEIVEKRNALTHPKTPEDLKISPDEHNKAADTFRWFFRVFQELISACRATRKFGGRPGSLR